MEIDTQESQRRLRTLTQRELEVCKLTIQGLSNSAIAVRLGIAEVTVRGYKTDMYDKLGIGHASQITRERELFDNYGELVEVGRNDLEAPLSQEFAVTKSLENDFSEVGKEPNQLSGIPFNPLPEEREGGQSRYRSSQVGVSTEGCSFWIWVFLGLCGILLFLNWDMWFGEGKAPPTQVVVASTTVPPQMTETKAATQTVTPTRFQVPTFTPQAIDAKYPGVTVKISNVSRDFLHEVAITTFVGGELLFHSVGDSPWWINSAIQDVSGGWTLKDHGGMSLWTENGSFVGGFRNPEIESGDGMQSKWLQDHNFHIGCWDEGNDPRYLIVPVYPLKRTNITFNLALIRIGVLSTEGKALVDQPFIIGVKKSDLTGEYIEQCHASGSWDFADDQGIVRFPVVAGDYYISREMNKPVWQYIGHVEPGDVLEALMYFE